MKLTARHITDVGRTDDWRVTSDVEGMRPGIGKTWGNALEAWLRANLPALGITRLVTDDQFNNDNPLVAWEDEEHR